MSLNAILIAVFLSISTTSFARPDGESAAVTAFNDNFRQQILDNSTYLEAFDLSGLTAQQAADAFYQDIYAVGESVSVEAINFTASVAALSVYLNFDALTADITKLVDNYGISAGDSLQVIGLLDESNAIERSGAYTQSIIKSIETSFSKDDATSGIFSLVNGFGNYFNDLGVFTPVTIPMFGALFSNAVYSR